MPKILSTSPPPELAAWKVRRDPERAEDVRWAQGKVLSFGTFEQFTSDYMELALTCNQPAGESGEVRRLLLDTILADRVGKLQIAEGAFILIVGTGAQKTGKGRMAFGFSLAELTEAEARVQQFEWWQAEQATVEGEGKGKGEREEIGDGC